MTGKELRRLRKSLGISQAAFARIMDVTVTTISRWECGHRAIGPLRADGIRARVASREA